MSVEEKAKNNTRKKPSTRKEKASNLEKAVVEKLRTLPVEKQQEVLNFVESLEELEERNPAKQPLKSARGLWADLNFDVSEEDIVEVRKEMWGNFPRDITI